MPAAGLAVLYHASRRWLVALAAIGWALYAVYEYGMKRRWLCTGECNIRVDLLLLYPLLLGLSVAAVLAGVRGVRRRRGAPEQP